MKAQCPLSLKDVPPHIDPDAVIDYDMYGDSRFHKAGDLHEGLFSLAEEAGRGIFWTPRNGGHWFINDHELLFQAARDTELFSSNGNPNKSEGDGAIIMIPAFENGGEPSFGPLTFDPPRHGAHRLPLMKGFAPNEIKRFEAGIRVLAADLIA